jgi:hypothetical protein
MTFSFHPEAEEELHAAIDHYEGREAGHGYDSSRHPKAWPIVEHDVRRCLMNRFPSGVLYSVEPTSIFVIAVMLHRRRPDYWKSR